MLTLAERRDRLRAGPLFASLDATSLDNLMVCLRWRNLNAGEALYRQGAAGDSMAILVEGSLAVSVHLQRGGEYEVERVYPGGIIGEIVCLDPSTRSATVVALEPSLVAELGRDAFRGLRGGAPEVYAVIMRHVIGLVSRRLRALNRRIDAEISPGEPARARTPSVRPSARPSAPPASAPGTIPPGPGTAASPSDRPPHGSTLRDGYMGLIDRLLGRTS